MVDQSVIVELRSVMLHTQFKNNVMARCLNLLVLKGQSHRRLPWCHIITGSTSPADGQHDLYTIAQVDSPRAGRPQARLVRMSRTNVEASSRRGGLTVNLLRLPVMSGSKASETAEQMLHTHRSGTRQL